MSSSDALPLRGKRILLAEDDDGTRNVLARVLANLGADVIETRDGGRMLVAIASHYKDGRSPSDLDLVVTDVNMPVVSGLEIFKGFRAAAWRTPVIVVTASDTQEVRDVVKRFGAVLMLKPIELDELERVVLTLLTGP